MKTQLFKTDIPSSVLFSFLEEFADDKGGYYIFSNISYNRAKYHDKLNEFCDEIRPHYHKAKQHYVLNKMGYNNLTTVIRQICKANLITYTSKVNYRQSTYDIIYYIYK